jgi:cellulose synthase/poly-beta-1,6-N-acetylglucosamine synthase-like glycosyltransferase
MDTAQRAPIISGAFGLFQRQAVKEAGGYATDTVGEDMELVVRLHRHYRARNIPYRIEAAEAP